MNGDKVHEALELRRRLALQALGIRPKDLRTLVRFTGPQVSFLLRGERDLTEEEQHRLASLVLRRMQRLFAKEEER